ncbi:MAG TPA: type IIL restriction-modification enzyme MmeI, partial [Polyangiaceae bacterium]
SVLGPLLAADRGFHIHAANTRRPWPGNAQVLVSTLFLERGLPGYVTRPRLLDERPVGRINSRLRAGDEWPEPEPLPDNAGLALVGCFLRGEGFILEPDEANAFLKAHPAEAHVIRPFLTGDDLNNTPDQRALRFVVDFRDMTLDEARCLPHALSIVEERVRPGRERLKTKGADAEHRKYWWRFANVRKELRERAGRLGRAAGPRLNGEPRLLATARVSKHSSFAFVPASFAPSEQVVVFPLASSTAFAVLQSRVHRVWVALQATRMGEGIRYSAGDCFLPFPFPERDPRAVLPGLESIGQRLYDARAALMRERGVGLTAIYNLLAGESPCEPAIGQLRELCRELDRAVLDAYGWTDIAVPPFVEVDQDFEDAVAGRLFALNAARAATSARPRPGETRAAMHGSRGTASAGPRKARPRAAKPGTTTTASTASRKRSEG